MVGERTGPEEERYSIAVVTLEESTFPEMRRALAPSFKLRLASTEEEITGCVIDAGLHGIVFDLDSIGDGPRDGIEVLKVIRSMREDLVLVATTASREHGIPFRASQNGADEIFLAPVNYAELQIVLARAIEKRAMETEGRRLV